MQPMNLGDLTVRNLELRPAAPAIIFEGRSITHAEMIAVDGSPTMLIVESILRCARVRACKEGRRSRIKEAPQ